MKEKSFNFEAFKKSAQGRLKKGDRLLGIVGVLIPLFKEFLVKGLEGELVAHLEEDQETNQWKSFFSFPKRGKDHPTLLTTIFDDTAWLNHSHGGMSESGVSQSLDNVLTIAFWTYSTALSVFSVCASNFSVLPRLAFSHRLCGVGAGAYALAHAHAPKAYLNFLVFDQYGDPILPECGFVRITTNSKEDGSDVPHDTLKIPQPIVINQAGYVYIYISNENDDPVEVFFDDFKVEHIKSPVVQMDDYYPYGLTYNSYSRENGIIQNHLYNGKELQGELSLGVYDYGFRTYDPAVGRWSAPDALAHLAFSLTPYRYCFSNPVNYTDPLGLWEKDKNGNYSTTDKKEIERFAFIFTNRECGIG